MTRVTSKIKNKPGLNVSIFEQVAFWSLAILLFVSPFFRGLFFAENQRVALIVAAIIFWLVCLIQNNRTDKKLFLSTFDYLIFALPIIYAISSFNAVNYSLAVDEIIENLLYFFVFWSAARLVRGEFAIHRMLIVIYLSAIGVAFVGLFSATGLLNIKDSFLPINGGIIASTFQYKNTLASFLTTSIFIGSYFWGSQTNWLKRIILITSNFVIITVFFSTQSHGGYIIFTLFTVLFWFLNSASNRFELIVSTCALVICGFLESKMFLFAVINKNIALAWLFMVAGMFLVAVGQYAILKLFKKEFTVEISFGQLIIGITIVAILGLVVIGATGIYQALMNKLHTFGALERLTMYEDSLKMIKEKPLLGWGGGGWSEAYSIYQSYAYTSRQTHSYFLQLAIETGIIGLLVALTLWLKYLTTVFNLHKKMSNGQKQALLAVLITSVLAIISHAVIDFNLSLAALTMVMYTLMACTIALDQNQESRLSKNIRISPKYQLAMATILVICVIFTSSTLIYAKQISVAAYQAIRSGDGIRAISIIEKSLSFNPLVAENYSLAAQLYRATGNQEKADQYAKRTTELATHNPDRYVELAWGYLQNNKNQEAVAAAQKALSLAPLKVQYYEEFAEITTRASLNELITGEKAMALNFAQQTLAIPEKINMVLASTPPDKKKLWTAIAKPLVVSDKIKVNLGIANMVNGNIDEAEQLVNEAANNPAVKQNVYLWQAFFAQKRGNNQRAEEILNSASKENPNIRREFAELVKLNTLISEKSE